MTFYLHCGYRQEHSSHNTDKNVQMGNESYRVTGEKKKKKMKKFVRK